MRLMKTPSAGGTPYGSTSKRTNQEQKSRSGECRALGEQERWARAQATRTIPIVFPEAGDPLGTGLVESLARPGGKAIGFMPTEFSEGGKAGTAQGGRAKRHASSGPSR